MTTRVLLVVDSAVIGGVARLVVNVARGLRTPGRDVRTVFPSWANNEFVDWCRQQGVEPELTPALTSLSSSGPVGGLKSWRALCAYLRDADADVVNFHYGGSVISLKDIVAARLAGVRRCIASVHLVAQWHVERPLKRPMTGIAGALCDNVVAVSGAVARGQLQAGVPRTRLTVIRNGVRRPETHLSQRQARERLKIPTDEFIAVAAARLAPVKRLQDLIEAVALLRGRGIPARAVIAGDGPERASLERLAQTRAAGAIDFLGQMTDASDLYNASDAVVLPSEREGQPLAALEAAVHGRPCIGTAIPGLNEVIEEGTTGFLVPVGTPHQIAQKLAVLYRNPDLATQIGAAALRRADQHFTIDRVISRYERVLLGS